ncbi:MAG TPA: LysR family transcriptional regulator [Microvirga sp.]|jgi:LysR family transcriptional activator of mexEF-oprN operon|nr:LysR family transcriptional regulator [Microvirga sp.]
MKHEFSEIELRKLDLNLLLVFSALMRERSVSRASKRLFIGPSAVSMALTRLRDAVGDALFVRASAGMEPTPRALALWSELEPALANIELAVRGLRRFDPATADLTIRFAAPDDLEFVLVPLLLERLETEAPGVRLVVRPSDFRTLLGRLDEGDADVALSATPTNGIERRHRIRPLHRDGFSVLYDAKRLGREGALDLDTYLEVPHLLLSITGDLHGLMDERLAEMGRSRRVIAAVSHFPTMPYILRRRRALANMPSVAARYYAETYGLELSPPPLTSPDFEVSLAWHARTDADPAQIWFRDLVAEAVADLRKGR